MNAALMALALSALAIAAGDDSSTAAETKAPIQISVRTEGPVGYFAPIFVRAEIRSSGPIDPECVRLVLHNGMGDLFAGDGSASCEPEEVRNPVCTTLGSGGGKQGRIDVSCRLDPRLSMLRTLTSARMLLGPQTEKGQLAVRLVSGNEDTGELVLADVPLTLAPPKAAVAYGGFFGAFLLGLFLLLRERTLRTPPARLPDLKWSEWRPYLGRGLNAVLGLFQQAFAGGIVALVIILIARASEGVQPPITVSVQDFWGGTLIGLFSIPLSEWLFGTLKSLPGKRV